MSNDFDPVVVKSKQHPRNSMFSRSTDLLTCKSDPFVPEMIAAVHCSPTAPTQHSKNKSSIKWKMPTLSVLMVVGHWQTPEHFSSLQVFFNCLIFGWKVLIECQIKQDTVVLLVQWKYTVRYKYADITNRQSFASVKQRNLGLSCVISWVAPILSCKWCVLKSKLAHLTASLGSINMDRKWRTVREQESGWAGRRTTPYSTSSKCHWWWMRPSYAWNEV